MTGTPVNFDPPPGHIPPQHGEGHIPPQHGEDHTPTGPSAEDLSDLAELEAAASAAGLALEDWSDTPEGRNAAEEMGRRAETRAIAAGDYVPPGPTYASGYQASQNDIDEWQRGEDGSLMPPGNFAVDGEGGYVYSPPAPPAGASTGEAEAAAAGMSVADWALTAEGIAFADEQEALALDQIAASNGGVFPPNTPAFSDERIRIAQEKFDRQEQLRALNEKAWNTENGYGIVDGDVDGYNTLGPDGMARPAIGAKAPDHVVSSFLRDENGNIEIPSDWKYEGGEFLYDPPGWEINDNGEYIDLGDEARRLANQAPRGYVPETAIQARGTSATDAQMLGWARGDDGSIMPPPDWAVDGDGGYVYSPPSAVLNGVSADTFQVSDISSLQFNEIKDLNKYHFSSFDPTAMAGFGRDQVANFDPTAIGGFSKEHFAAFNPTAMAGFDHSHVAAFDPMAVAGFDDKHIAAFDTAAMAGFNADHVAALDAQAIAGLDRDQFAAFDPTAMAGFNADHFAAIDYGYMAGLGRDHVAAFDPMALAGFDPEHVAAFDPMAVAGFDQTHFAAFDPMAVAGFDQTHFAAFDPMAMAGFDPEHVAAFDPMAVAGFDHTHAAAFDPMAVAGFDQTHFAAFDPTAVSGFNHTHFAAFEPSAMEGFNPFHVAAFDAEAMAGFKGQTLKELDPESFAAVTTDQLAKMAPDAAAAVKNWVLPKDDIIRWEGGLRGPDGAWMSADSFFDKRTTGDKPAVTTVWTPPEADAIAKLGGFTKLDGTFVKESDYFKDPSSAGWTVPPDELIKKDGGFRNPNGKWVTSKEFLNNTGTVPETDEIKKNGGYFDADKKWVSSISHFGEGSADAQAVAWVPPAATEVKVDGGFWDPFGQWVKAADFEKDGWKTPEGEVKSTIPAGITQEQIAKDGGYKNEFGSWTIDGNLSKDHQVNKTAGYWGVTKDPIKESLKAGEVSELDPTSLELDKKPIAEVAYPWQKAEGFIKLGDIKGEDIVHLEDDAIGALGHWASLMKSPEDGDDRLEGGETADKIFGGLGSDFIDGGKGEDVAFYAGNFADYKFDRTKDTVGIKDQREGLNDGNDTLKNVEYIQFADQKVDVSKIDVVKTYTGDSKDFKFFKREDGTIEVKTENGFDDITGVPKLEFNDKSFSGISDIKDTFDQVKSKDDATGQMFRVYNAAFARFPDSDGLEYWIDKNSSGENSNRQVADSFLGSEEFKSTYGADVDTGTYVNNLYKNILGRDADQGGYDYWVEQLDSELENRGELLLGFAESIENQALFSEVTGLF